MQCKRRNTTLPHYLKTLTKTCQRFESIYTHSWKNIKVSQNIFFEKNPLTHKNPLTISIHWRQLIRPQLLFFFCFETEEDWIVQIQTIDQESFSIVVQSTRPIISWKNTFPLKFLDKCHEKYFSIPFHEETNVIELVTLTFCSSVVDVWENVLYPKDRHSN